MIDPLKSKSNFLEDIRKTMKRTGVSLSQLGNYLSMSQSGVSKLLRGKRRLSYTEADQMTSFLFSKMTLLSPNASADAKAVKEEELTWAYSDEKLCDVAERMFMKGFNQLPVRVRSTNSFMGMVTDMSILERMMNPNENIAQTLKDWSETRIDEAEIIEDIISLPHDTALVEVSENLMRSPAILLTKRGGITGIITRADILRYLFEDKPIMS